MSSRRRVTLGVLGGIFLAAIEGTIVATAMPTVVEQLGGLAHYSWVFAAYILTSTVTIPLWGRLSDLYGRRRFYLAAIGLFLLGSMLSGAAQSMEQLIVFRAIQGMGAGGLLPLGMTIIGDMYTLEERARAQAWFSSVWGIASIVGPLVGGFVTSAISWRWVFYLNLPFGAVAAYLVGSALVDRPTSGVRIDYAGAGLLAASVSTLLVALGQTGSRDAVLAASTVTLLYVAAAVLLVAFLAVERRTTAPIVPLDLFANRLVSSATLTGFLVGVAMFGALAYVPLFVQSALGRSATRAGSALTPLLLGWVGMSAITSRLVPRLGFRPMVIAGTTFVMLGFFGLTRVTHDSPMLFLYLALGVAGMGMGMCMLTLLLAQQSAVPRERLGIATSLGQFSRSIGGAVGVAIMGSVITATLSAHGDEPAAGVLELALHRAFVTGAIVSVVALASAFLVPSGLPLTRASARLDESSPSTSKL